ncbi:rna-directed dna polymerase from mobile element jockey-like [Limosa lapponica baueri]|uniref:Rna-directed dna polymerase from mobile element jockey-like n=1 Tax=Limosa lapponica baueri TaxID=1758121 RepID=A0A2I0U1F2_LIMLA|nr:rna-directed dna polymerase from mobile element jockey-like [Limosa lapponica baueri]
MEQILLEGKWIEYTLSKFANDTKLSGAVDTLERHDANQRDLDRLKKWACVILMKLNKAKLRVLHLGWDNPCYQYRLEDEEIENRLMKKDLGVSKVLKGGLQERWEHTF